MQSFNTPRIPQDHPCTKIFRDRYFCTHMYSVCLILFAIPAIIELFLLLKWANWHHKITKQSQKNILVTWFDWNSLSISLANWHLEFIEELLVWYFVISPDPTSVNVIKQFNTCTCNLILFISMQVAMEEALTVNFTKRKHLRKEQQ